MRSEPFQIFTLQYRDTVIKQNPGMGPAETMSLLGHMWQELPRQEKDAYLLVAYDSLHDQARRRHRKQSVTVRPASPESPPTVSSDESTPVALTDIEEPAGEVVLPRLIHPPLLFSITPRGKFGCSAAAASDLFIFEFTHGHHGSMREGRALH
jgi:hypothetical protein